MSAQAKTLGYAAARVNAADFLFWGGETKQ